MKLLHLTFVAALAALSLAVSGVRQRVRRARGRGRRRRRHRDHARELDELVEQAKRTYEAQKQEFPKVGTPEYQNVQKQYVAFLVQREQFEQEAEELGDRGHRQGRRRRASKSSSGRASRASGQSSRRRSKEQGFTERASARRSASSVLSQKLFDEVTKDVEVTDAEVARRTTSRTRRSTATPESRDVRHILIAEKDANGQVDFAKSKAEADRIYAQLQDGGDFAALAKEHSADTGLEGPGGKLTVTRGQTVPEFDKTAFDAEGGRDLAARQDEYGYHIIEALSPVREAKTTPLEEVRASIKATLLQEKKNDVHDGVGRGPAGRVRGQGQLRGRLRAAGAPGRPTARPRPTRPATE